MTVIAIPKLHTEAVAAEALGISIDTLQRLRRAGRIGFKRIGQGRGRIRYTESHLNDYLTSCEEACDKIDPGNSGSIGSENAPTADNGAVFGTTQSVVKLAMHRLAQTTKAKPICASLNGSWRTVKSETSDHETPR
jgi:excisionase family DNA binding protein